MKPRSRPVPPISPQVSTRKNVTSFDVIDFREIFQACRKLGLEDGGTWSPYTMSQPKSGISCAFQGTQLTLPDSVFSLSPDEFGNSLSGEKMKLWHQDMMQYWLSRLAHIGVWRNEDGQLELETSVVLPSMRQAVRLGRHQNQWGVFNLRTFQPKETGGTNSKKWIPASVERAVRMANVTYPAAQLLRK